MAAKPVACGTCAHTRARHLRSGACRSCECPEFIDARALARTIDAPTAPPPPEPADLPPLDVPPVPPTLADQPPTGADPDNPEAKGAVSEPHPGSAPTSHDAPPPTIGGDDSARADTGEGETAGRVNGPPPPDWLDDDPQALADAIGEQLRMLDDGIGWVSRKTGAPLPGIPDGSRRAAAPPLGRIIGRWLGAHASPDAVAVAIALGVPIAANAAVLAAWYLGGGKHEDAPGSTGTKPPIQSHVEQTEPAAPAPGRLQGLGMP